MKLIFAFRWETFVITCSLGILFIFSSIHMVYADNQKPGVIREGAYFGEKLPGTQPVVFAPGIVSTDDHFENSCTFTPDGKEIYFTRNAGLRSDGECRIMVCKLEKGRWTLPVTASFSSGPVDFEPNITPDGKKLYFNRIHPTDKTFKRGIWVVEREQAGWGEPKFYRSQAMFLTESANGTIYFTDFSDIKNFSIVYSRLSGGKYTGPKPVGGGVNSSAFDAHSCISPDEKFIIFDSRRDAQKGYNELYICFRGPGGNWSEAICLGDKLGKGAKMAASLSPDGKFLFYSTNKSINWVSMDVIEGLSPF